METIAIVGLSEKTDRPSHQVGLYLKNQGFNIIPINPNIKEIFGVKSFKSISDIPMSIKIDIVDVFRKPDDAIKVIEEIINSGRKVKIWLQEGVGSPEAKKIAQENGLEIVMDMCMMKAHQTSKK